MADLIDTLEPPHPADARLEEDSRLSRVEAVAALQRIQALKGQKKAIDDELSDLEALVKSVLEDGEPLVDGEHGLMATLVERRRPAEIDLISFAEKPDAARLLAEAATQGVLSARLTQLRGLAGKSEAADALLRMEVPGGVNHVLTIERVD